MRQAIGRQNGMDEKVYDVEIRPRPANDGEQVAFLAEFNTKQRNALCKCSKKGCEALAQLPKRVPELNDAYWPPHKYRKLLFPEHYLMVYHVAERKVYVDFIVDCRQDYQWLIR